MDALLTELQRYLHETLDVTIHYKSWQDQETLPIYLTNAYHFKESSILNQPCLFMFAQELNGNTPANIRKHWEQVSHQYPGITIYVQTAITAYDRKRLIGQKIPFIVPSKQMYLPEMGIELREHFQRMRLHETPYLSPAAQTVVIYALAGKMEEKSTASTLAKELGYSTMTISRVFDELASTNIGEINKAGKERWWISIVTKQDLWQQAKPKLRSPTKEVIWIKQIPESVKPTMLAGESALSQYSSLNPPTLPVYAIHKTIWTNLQKDVIEESIIPQEALFELQIWHYNPALLSDSSTVDPFSLYLSLKDTYDERIEIALDEMMKEYL